MKHIQKSLTVLKRAKKNKTNQDVVRKLVNFETPSLRQLKKTIRTVKNESLAIKLIEELEERAKMGDRGALRILNNFSSRKINPNQFTRMLILECVRNLSDTQNVFRGLVAGLKSPNVGEMIDASVGFQVLSKRGDKRVFPILKDLIKSKKRFSRMIAIDGLADLAEHGDFRVFGEIIKLKDVKDNLFHQSFLRGINALARKGDLNAKVYLEKNPSQRVDGDLSKLKHM
ncbi:MAG: hypothetical protein PHY04_00845 [Candidatus ainarchaeum sp.]|jgi:hypothetical protein|nr:hypothetical protein [Candidatus ainarchaeum sp.]HPM85510.1 hypothetical protein [archaeon]